MSARAWRTAALVLFVATASARGAVRVHLLDLDARLPPQLELGGVMMPIISFTPGGRASIGGADTTVPEDGRLEVPLALPPGWTPGQLLANALVVTASRTHWQAPTLRRETTPPIALFEFNPDEVGTHVRLVVIGMMVPLPGPRRVAFGPVIVAPGSRLRLAVGVPPSGCHAFVPTRVQIEADDGRQRRPVFNRSITTPPCDVWMPIDVPLDAVAGERVRFRLRLRGRRTPDGSRALTLEVADPIVEPPPSATRPPNVIVVSLDTLAAKHLGLYGYPHPTSPGLDALAPAGVVFERATAHYPSTAASHMSLFTSRLPAAHGVRGYLDVLAPSVTTLPRALRADGFLTAAFTEDATLAAAMGFGRGFHHYRENRSATLWGTRGRVRRTLSDAVAWLDSRPGEPFFLFVHTYQVHTPYTPPPSHRRAVRPESEAYGPPLPVELYDGEIHYLDERLARFVRYLRTRGLLDHTILVVTADHGESFGEHGHEGHGHCLHEEVMHVPLVLLGPGIAAGRRVPDRVGLVDVAPTILDLVGAKPLPDADGRSLLPALRGDRLAERAVVAELEGPLGPIGGIAKPNERAVWIGDEKAIVDVETGAFRFSDLADNPDEAARTRLPPAAAFAAMKAALDAYEAMTPVPGGAIVGESVVTPDAIEKLRALGYLE